MTKLLLIDLDGTARTTVSGQVCPTYPKDQVLLARTESLCQKLARDNWIIAAITNQGGCEAINADTGKPYKTHRQAVSECKYFLDIAPWCDRVYMCPNGKMSDRDEVYRINRFGFWPFRKYSVVHEYNDDHPDFQTQGYRKPKPGMLELAIREQEEIEYTDARSLGLREREMVEINVKALMVGDMESDRAAASALKLPYLPVENFQLETVVSLNQMLDKTPEA